MGIIIPILIGLAILASGFFKDQNQQSKKNQTNTTRKKPIKPQQMTTMKRRERPDRTQLKPVERPKRQSRKNETAETLPVMQNTSGQKEKEVEVSHVAKTQATPIQQKKRRDIRIKGNDLVRAVIMSEVIGPPKSKRKR